MNHIDLKGMWELLLARAYMTSPRADNDLLMLWVSLSRSPCTSVFATRSLPAKSTNHSLLFVHSPVNKFSPFTMTQCMLCREKKLRLGSWSPETFSEKGDLSYKPVRSAAVLISRRFPYSPCITSCFQHIPNLLYACHSCFNQSWYVVVPFIYLPYLKSAKNMIWTSFKRCRTKQF